MKFFTIQRKGQAIILTVLAIGGSILGATAIAGLLMLYQIRSATDFRHSAQAIFGADAGTNQVLFDHFCTATNTYNPVSRCATPASYSSLEKTIENGTVISITCYDGSGTQSACDSSSSVTAVSIGTSLTSKRAFSLSLPGVTTTPP